MSNGPAYTQFELEAFGQLKEINQKLDQFKEWTEKHDVARAKRDVAHDALVTRVDSLEHSRTWLKGSIYTLWLLVSSGIALVWRKLLS